MNIYEEIRAWLGMLRFKAKSLKEALNDNNTASLVILGATSFIIVFVAIGNFISSFMVGPSPNMRRELVDRVVKKPADQEPIQVSVIKRPVEDTNYVPPDEPITTKGERIIVTGSNCVLRNSGDRAVPVFVDSKAYARFNQLSVALDYRGITRELIYTGKVFLVSSNTSTKVIKRGFLTSEVRIMDGKYSGKSGIVDSDFLHW